MELRDLKFKLPNIVVSREDISRLIAEVDGLNDFFLQMKLGKVTKDKMPQVSKSLDQVVQMNGANLMNEPHRARLKLVLQTVRTKAPLIHISFSGEPSGSFMEKIITWMRDNIHPLTILEIGLEPNIGVGFTLRTPNKVFDFSLRQHLQESVPLLGKAMYKGVNE